jgi:hypothetical protein
MSADVFVATLSHLSRTTAWAVAMEKAAWHAERAGSSRFHCEMASAWLRCAACFEG